MSTKVDLSSTEAVLAEMRRIASDLDPSNSADGYTTTRGGKHIETAAYIAGAVRYYEEAGKEHALYMDRVQANERLRRAFHECEKYSRNGVMMHLMNKMRAAINGNNEEV